MSDTPVSPIRAAIDAEDFELWGPPDKSDHVPQLRLTPEEEVRLDGIRQQIDTRQTELTELERQVRDFYWQRAQPEGFLVEDAVIAGLRGLIESLERQFPK